MYGLKYNYIIIMYIIFELYIIIINKKYGENSDNSTDKGGLASARQLIASPCSRDLDF